MNPLGFHSGFTTSSDRGPIDKPWSFFTNTRDTNHHFTVGSGITDNGDGTLDMTNWRMTWKGRPEVDLGGDPLNYPSDTGMGIFTVSGTNYTLDYNVRHSLVDYPEFFPEGEKLYKLHLEGRIIPAAIPEPGTLLLVGSGLVGIFGLARKRRE